MNGSLAFAAVAVTLVLVPAAPELNEESFPRWRDYIRPAKEEVRWQEIPWRASFLEAVTEARKTDKPVLVWAMNGHPLACT